jgi:hypothetical protein
VAKDQFYSTVYSITLNPICVTQRVSKNVENVEPKLING